MKHRIVSIEKIFPRFVSSGVSLFSRYYVLLLDNARFKVWQATYDSKGRLWILHKESNRLACANTTFRVYDRRWLVYFPHFDDMHEDVNAVLEESGLYDSLRSVNNKYALQSRVICALAGDFLRWGSDLPKSVRFIVHHKNQDTSDDRHENLKVLREDTHEHLHEEQYNLLSMAG